MTCWIRSEDLTYYAKEGIDGVKLGDRKTGKVYLQRIEGGIMYKINFIAIVSLLIFFSCKITTALPAETSDASEIQEVAKAYLDTFANRDFDGMMELISPNYYYAGDEGPVNYAQLRLNQKRRMDNIYKKGGDFSYSEVKISDPDIRGNIATVNVEFKLQALNLETLERAEAARSIFFTLAKEDGAWKIIQIKRPKGSQD